MKRVQFDRFGPPPEVLYLAEVPDPAPGPGEVLLRIRMRPINPADIAYITGHYVPPESWPASPGMEAVGTVAALGDGVDNVTIGQRCIISRYRGTWADFMAVPAKAVMLIADDISDEVACQLSVNPLTALLLLKTVTRPGAIVQTAAGSAVGRLVNQIASLQGRTIINLARRADTAADLKARGCRHVIITSDQDWQGQVREAAGAEPVVAAFDPVAGAIGQALLAVLSKGGELILYGALSGEAVPVNAMQLAGNDLSVRGFWLAPWYAIASREEKQRVFHELEDGFRKGQLSIPVAGVHPLVDFKRGVEQALAPGRLGKVLLRE